LGGGPNPKAAGEGKGPGEREEKKTFSYGEGKERLTSGAPIEPHPNKGEKKRAALEKKPCSIRGEFGFFFKGNDQKKS